MLLRDRVCVISGVGPGLGRALALLFAEQGAELVLLGRNPEHAARVASELPSGRAPLCLQADISELSQCAQALERVHARYGRLDVLVNNAFATGSPGPIAAELVMKAWRPPFTERLKLSAAGPRWRGRGPRR